MFKLCLGQAVWVLVGLLCVLLFILHYVLSSVNSYQYNRVLERVWNLDETQQHLEFSDREMSMTLQSVDQGQWVVVAEHVATDREAARFQVSYTQPSKAELEERFLGSQIEIWVIHSHPKQVVLNAHVEFRDHDKQKPLLLSGWAPPSEIDLFTACAQFNQSSDNITVRYAVFDSTGVWVYYVQDASLVERCVDMQKNLRLSDLTVTLIESTPSEKDAILMLGHMLTSSHLLEDLVWLDQFQNLQSDLAIFNFDTNPNTLAEYVKLAETIGIAVEYYPLKTNTTD